MEMAKDEFKIKGLEGAHMLLHIIILCAVFPLAYFAGWAALIRFQERWGGGGGCYVHTLYTTTGSA